MSVTVFIKQKAILNSAFVRLFILLLIISLSYIWITVIIKTDITKSWDAGVYISNSKLINEQGLLNYYDPVRTYGYPLFLSTIYRLFAPFVSDENWLQVVVAIQFVFHTVTSLLSVRLIKRLIPEQSISLMTEVACFSVVQLNPVLLGLTRDILTDSFTVFLISLFLYLLLSSARWKYLQLSICLSYAAIVRPFNYTWGLIFLGLVLAFFGIQQIATHGVREIIKVDKRYLFSRASQLIIPGVLIIGLQYHLVYKIEGTNSLVGKTMDDILALNTGASTYFYKYETYVGPEERSPGIAYLFSKRVNAITASGIPVEKISVLQTSLSDPIGAIQSFTVKLIGLFQNYEWSTYRTTTINTPNIVFWWGLFFFTFFVYVNWNFLSLFKFELKQGSRTLLILLAVDLYAVSYTVFTIPEGRFIVPVLPALAALTFVFFIQKRNWRDLFIIAVVCLIGYILTYGILLESMR